MNRKISTLMASVLFASAFSTAAYAVISTNLGKGLEGKTVALWEAGAGTDVLSVNADGELEQLAATSAFATGYTPASPTLGTESSFTTALRALWTVASVKFDPTTGVPTYQFVNKKTGTYLAIDLVTDNNGSSTKAVKMDGTGNRDWSLHNGVLYAYAKDSIYTLTAGTAGLAGKFTLTAVEGAALPGSGLTIGTDVAADEGQKVNLTAEGWNEMMAELGSDGKLHFNNSKDVSTGEENLLTKNKYVAYNLGATTTFALAQKDEVTSVNKNPYVLMVSKDQYASALDNFFKFAIDTLAISKTDAGTLTSGGYNASTPTLEFKQGYTAPLETAKFSAEYYYANDSVALQVAGMPGKYVANNFAVTDGKNAWSTLGTAATDADTKENTIKAYKDYPATTPNAVKVLKAAVDAWLAAVKLKGFAADSYTTDKFATSVFVTATGAIGDGSGVEAAAVGASGVWDAADIYVKTNASATKEEAAFVAAVKNLERKKLAAGDDELKLYFAEGLPTPAVSATVVVPLITELSSTKVLTVDVKANADSYIKPMVQPFEKAASGDAEITASAGLFFMKVENAENKLLRAASLTRYVVEDIAGNYEYQEVVDETNPYAQWVFIPGAAGSYSIVNRGSNNPFYSGMISVVKDENGKAVADTYVIGKDTLKLGAVTLNTDNVYTEDKKQYDYSGFFYAGPQAGKTMSFAIAPVSPFMSSLAMQVQADSTVILGDAENAPIWYFEEKAGTTYGAPIAGVPQLKSVGYNVYMKDENGVKYYIEANTATGNFEITKHDSKATMDVLYFRTVAKDTYLITNGLTPAANKMTINPTPAQPIIEVTAATGTRNDYFTVGKSSVSHYRTLTAEDGVNGNAAIYLNNEESRYLYENSANIVANNGTKFAKDSLNFLGIFNAFELDKNPTVYVDTAYVDRAGNVMPQYMFALGVEDVPATAGAPCTSSGVHVDKNGKPTTADKCEHATPATAGYKAGRYLVVLTDSTENKSAKYDNATRLAFVPAKHYLGQDSLVIDNSKWTGNTKVMTAGKADTYASKDTIKIENNKLKAATFALLIKNQADQSFYLQTVDDATGKAQYVRILNGVPVLTNSKDDAAIFNIAASEEEATANEAIEAAGVQVIGGKGAVTVQGAAGKVITVANVLGQTIANQVAASDNVTIAAPAGVVVVAVDGDATKVVVK